MKVVSEFHNSKNYRADPGKTGKITRVTQYRYKLGCMKRAHRTLLIFFLATASLGQAPSGKKPEFEVASVKLDKASEGTAALGDQPGGRFVASRVSLRRLMQFAYRGNQDFIGGPNWIDTDLWDIEAKAPEGAVPRRASPLDVTKPDATALMVQSLLEDRFKLKSHQETRELPLYELTVAKGGAKLKLSEDQTPPAALVATGNGGRGAAAAGDVRLGRNNMDAKAQPVELLAAALGALYADRPVLDKTGLKGLYDFRLQWTPDRSSRGANPTSPPVSQGLSLFDALEEQLGLRLTPGKGPLPVLVIDSVQKPLEN
jgi:uncharacterized protein (TIGR03435 family)